MSTALRGIVPLAALAAGLWLGCDETVDTVPAIASSAAQGGSGGQGQGAMAGAGGEGGGASPWEQCSLFTDGNDGGAECATFEMPAVRGDADAGIVHVFVKRVRTTAPRRGSVWLLEGGPGGSGVGFEGLVSLLQLMAPGLDVYIPDHRGTGRSDRLSCPAAEDAMSDEGPFISDAELPACIDGLVAEWGPKLPAFSNTQAAHDIGELIELTREPGDEPYVFGVSYGSQWGHRYLQLYPDQAAGVSLEAICIPQCYFTEIDEWFEALGHGWLNACGQDTFCSSKLGPDPWSVLGAAYANLASCAGLAPQLDASAIKTLLAQTLYAREDRKILPAIAYRLNRCSTADVNALNHLASVLFAPPPDPLPAGSRLQSSLLGLNVGLVDNMPDVLPDLATLQAAFDAHRVALGASIRFRQASDVWPLYPKDQYHGAFASPSVPLLLMHGGLDFIPMADVQAAADQLVGPGFNFVPLPGAPHEAAFQSPVVPMGLCGAQLLGQLLVDPNAALDTSCLMALAPLEFDVPPQLATPYFGTPDAYEGDPGPTSMAAGSPSPKMQEIAKRFRDPMPF
jgi:pimeloyl-ACP methyl ester carboxylesterase